MQAQVAPYVGIAALRGRVVVCDLARLVVGAKEFLGLTALLNRHSKTRVAIV